MEYKTSGQLSENKSYRYKFSVIMPIYNAEEYLEEAIESVIEQTIGFQDNIQLILVNNATEDNSGEICNRYVAKFPKNIVYIELKKNCGPSGARNAGVPHIKGKYVNFMDSDDKWEKNAFESAYNFFEREREHVDCIACRMILFDAVNGYHALDFRFETTRIINIHIFYNFLQLHVNSVFFKTELVRTLRFDEDMNHAEDTKYFNQIMLKRGQYGLMSTALYYYRKRTGNQSLLHQVQSHEDYYTNKIEKSLGYFIDYSISNYGMVIPYIQNMIIYALKYRIKEGFNGSVSPEVSQRALSLMSNYLQCVSTKIILEQMAIFKEHKLFALSLKFRRDIRDQLQFYSNDFYFWQYMLFESKERSICSVINIEIINEMLCLNGRINLPIPKNLHCILARDNFGNKYYLNYYKLDQTAQKRFLNVVYHEIYGFSIKIPMNELKYVEFLMEFRGENIPLNIGFWLVTKLSNNLKSTYFVKGNYIITYKEFKLTIEKRSFIKHIQKETNLLFELFMQKRARTIIWRFLIYLGKSLHFLTRKKWWLFLDTFSNAGDNAEYLFRYAVQRNDSTIKPIFCVSENSSSYQELKRIGKVIPYDTKRYRMLFALCDVLISSQTFYGTQNTFYERTDYLKDLFTHKFVYLQHGVIKDNHADTQSKHKKAVDMFITTGIPEYESLLQEEYGYDSSVVKLTGLARYDGIYNRERKSGAERSILLAPTWRKSSEMIWDEKSQTYKYNPRFRNSEFFLFYNSLLLDKRILTSLHSYNYKLKFQLHPRIWAQNVDFAQSDCVYIQREKIKLEEAIDSTNMLITDYSSIFFDYAYANIPIIYTQFDKDAFYANHAYTRGYFDFEEDGFGPVCYDYESTVKTIISAIENGCVMEEKYQKRVDSFFAYRDNKNCERIYQEILRLDKEI